MPRVGNRLEQDGRLRELPSPDVRRRFGRPQSLQRGDPHGDSVHAAVQSAGSDGLVATGSRWSARFVTAPHSSPRTRQRRQAAGRSRAPSATTTLRWVRRRLSRAGWSGKRCVDCHDSGSSASHDTYATAHQVQSGTCAGTGSGCHTRSTSPSSTLSGSPAASRPMRAAPMPTPAIREPATAYRPTAGRIQPGGICGERHSRLPCREDPDEPRLRRGHAHRHAGDGCRRPVQLPRVRRVPSAIGVNCADCHNTDLGATHVRICSTCHPAPRSSFASWNGRAARRSATRHTTATLSPPMKRRRAATARQCHAKTAPSIWSPDPCGSCHALYDAADTVAPLTTSNALITYTARLASRSR